MLRFLQLFFLFNISLILLQSCTYTDSQKKDVNLFYSQDLDSSSLPGNNFYQFVNGKTIKRLNQENPNNTFNYFDALQLKTDSLLFKLVSEVNTNQEYPIGSDARKLNHFLTTALDTQKIERQQNKPIEEQKKRIYSVETKQQFQGYILEDLLSNSSMFFDLNVLVHPQHSQKAALFLEPHALGVSELSMLSSVDAVSKDFRVNYFQFLTQLLIADGQTKPVAEAMASTTIKIETQLAKSRNQKLNSPQAISVNDLSSFFDYVVWPDALGQLGITIDSLYVKDGLYLKKCNELVKNTKLEELKQYAHTTLLRKAAPYLSKKFNRLHANFYFKSEKRKQDRWHFVLDELNQSMPDAMAQIYSKNTLNPLDINRVVDMANQIKWSFASYLKEVNWLTDSTKQKALDKLKFMKVSVGFPEKYLDYIGLTFQPDSLNSFYSQVITVRIFNKKRTFAALNKSSNERNWLITPQTVNAKYFLQRNEVVIPAAMLQAPFYQTEADISFNYGGIGVIIAHEISHAFDNTGILYDANGSFNPWLNELEREQLNKFYLALQNQVLLSHPEFQKSIFLRQMVGESFADLSGLEIAMNALQRDYEQFPEKRKPTVNGLTAEQRFFIAWAKLWLHTQPNRETSIDHTPPIFRVNSMLSNLKSFQDAFQIKQGQYLYKPINEQINIWSLKAQ